MSALCHKCGTQIDEDTLKYCPRCREIVDLEVRVEKLGMECDTLKALVIERNNEIKRLHEEMRQMEMKTLRSPDKSEATDKVIAEENPA